MTEKKTILVLGATGLFGELLTKRIAQEGQFEVVTAGRGEAALKRLKSETGFDYRLVDRDDAAKVAPVLGEIQPFAVVDCAGPFQYYGDDPYRFARQVVEASAHYLDIADAGPFVSGIGELDGLARERGVTVISGASSTPAISAAALDQLTADLVRVTRIENVIIPGNRARRTMSVMRAVLGQVGQTFAITRHGRRETVRGWSETRKIDLDVPGMPRVTGRLAAHMHTPDVDLFPDRYKAETVEFLAGLEVKLFHRALQLGGAVVSVGPLKSLEPFAGFARWLASWFEWVGSDAGGMQVKVVGELENGRVVERRWDLVADDGRGPEIPTLPVSILLEKLEAGEVAPGARPSPGEIALDEVAVQLAKIEAGTATHEREIVPVFKTVLGDAFDDLPPSIRELHSQFGLSVYEGRARTKGPQGPFGWLGARMIGFPGESNDVLVRVTITAKGSQEIWEREFDGKKFRSILGVDAAGFVQERFGPFTARLGLHLADGKLHYPIDSGKLFGVLPVPGFLLPVSIAHEEVDEEGRFVFDVLLKTPFGGRVAHYRGWLERVGI